MTAKIRFKCPHCGEATNVPAEVGNCPKCQQPFNLSGCASIFIYRQGSPYGIAGGFGLYIDEQPYGYIGNKELLRIPVNFGTHNIHAAVGMSRKCRDMQVTLTPQMPVTYTKVYIKPGFWANSFVIEPLDPSLLK